MIAIPRDGRIEVIVGENEIVVLLFSKNELESILWTEKPLIPVEVK